MHAGVDENRPFRDIGGVIRHAFDIFGDEHEIHMLRPAALSREIWLHSSSTVEENRASTSSSASQMAAAAPLSRRI